MICTGSGSTPCGSVNWGNSARKRRKTFGLRALMPTPLPNWAMGAAGATVESGPGATPGERSIPMPIQMR